MTIMATHFALVLGSWRLRIRIDIDEPRESAVESGIVRDETPAAQQATQPRMRPTFTSAPPWN